MSSLYPRRFNPLDMRCGMELDEIDPARWAELEAATRDYIAAEGAAFDAAATALTHVPDGTDLFADAGSQGAGVRCNIPRHLCVPVGSSEASAALAPSR